MRLDKFLKVSRIIKRRTVAKEVADKGRIQINGVLAKSSSTVKIGDLVKIQFGNRILEVEVLQLNDSTKKEDATKMYEIKSETRVSEEKAGEDGALGKFIEKMNIPSASSFQRFNETDAPLLKKINKSTTVISKAKNILEKSLIFFNFSEINIRQGS